MEAGRAMQASSSNDISLAPPSRDAMIRAESFQKVSCILVVDVPLQLMPQVKPICVQLMGLAKLPVSSYSPHAATLSSLYNVVIQLPAVAFSPGLINYLLFPLTHILRTSTAHPAAMPSAFLETAFRYLAILVGKWKCVEDGMDVVAWEQLWRFVMASASPPSMKNGADKGKGKERAVAMDQEVDVERIEVLSALLLPSPGHRDTFPTPAMRQGFSGPKSPLMPTLFQTISYTISQIHPTPPHLALQVSSLKLLRHLLPLLAGQQNILASVLPGLISAVAKLVQAEGKGMKGDVAEQAAGAVQDVLELTVSDGVLRRLGVLKAKVANLADLMGDEESAGTNGTTQSNGTTKDPFPPVTASWLDFTSAQLLSALSPILTTLAEHPSHSARIAAAGLASTILSTCFDSLGDIRTVALTTLLSLSQDDFDPVRHDARRQIRACMTAQPTLEDSLIAILSTSINSLPRAVTSQQDDKVLHHTRLISAMAEIAAVQAETGSRRNAISDLLGPNGQVERWCWSLLDCLEFGKPAGWNHGNAAARAAQLGWGQTFGGAARLLEDGTVTHPGGNGDTGDAGPTLRFPSTPFRHIESRQTVKALESMVRLLGKAGGESAIHSIEHFMRLAESRDETHAARSPAALWLVETLLQGIVESQLDSSEGRVSRKVRKLAKSITRRLVELDEADDGVYEESAAKGGEPEVSDALLPVERSQGINALSTLLDKPTLKDGYIASESRRLSLEAQRILLTCRSLSLLSLCARTLSSSFRPLLMHSLYIVLAQLASPHDIVRSHAETALSHIAYHTGYASARNMILDNVDYVINVVSQRLTPARLAIHAPLVLIAMIRLVGSEIVPLVQDVLNEIFDALDDYHGYETLCSSLLAVLVALIQSMSADILAEGPSAAHLTKKKEGNRVDQPPDPERDFARFEEWYSARAARRGEDVRGILDKAPQQAWSALPEDLKDGADAESSAGAIPASAPPGEAGIDENNANAEPDEIPLTRPQEVCKQILQKATYFLTHPSPFLRSRVLALTAAAIPVLAMGDRDGDLLPVIDKAWGGIMTRLRDDDDSTSVPSGGNAKGQAYVVTEAAEVVASLAEHVGDYMSRRVLDHAWPRFKELLERQREADHTSALSRTVISGRVQRGRPGHNARSGPWNFGTHSKFTKSHRLHSAILRAVGATMAQVPIDDKVVWDMLLSFRPFLDHRAHEELQRLAMGVYRAAGRRDGDAVWLVLSATLGAAGGDGWAWMREEGLQIGANAEVLLSEI